MSWMLKGCDEWWLTKFVCCEALPDPKVMAEPLGSDAAFDRPDPSAEISELEDDARRDRLGMPVPRGYEVSAGSTIRRSDSAQDHTV